MTEVIIHKIGDNQLMIDNKEFFGLNVPRVIVGVQNEQTGEAYGQEVYNLKTQKHHPWFILALETGSRGWCPGKLLYCNIIGTVDVKEQPNESSATLFQLTNAAVIIISTQSKEQIKHMKPEWWIKIKADQEGYIQIKDIDKNSLRYEVPSNSFN